MPQTTQLMDFQRRVTKCRGSYYFKVFLMLEILSEWKLTIYITAHLSKHKPGLVSKFSSAIYLYPFRLYWRVFCGTVAPSVLGPERGGSHQAGTHAGQLHPPAFPGAQSYSIPINEAVSSRMSICRNRHTADSATAASQNGAFCISAALIICAIKWSCFMTAPWHFL